MAIAQDEVFVTTPIYVFEFDLTPKIFTQPSDQRTEDYVTGRFG